MKRLILITALISAPAFADDSILQKFDLPGKDVCGENGVITEFGACVWADVEPKPLDQRILEFSINGNTIIQIDENGNIKYGVGVDPTEASRIFWGYIASQYATLSVKLK